MTAEDALVQLKPMNEAMRALGMDMGRLWLPEGECFDKTLVTILSRTAYRRRNGSSAGVCRDGSVELIADLPPTILRAFLAHEATHLRQISKILGRSGPRAGRYAHRCYLASLCEVEAKIIEVAAAKLAFMPQHAARSVLMVLKSATANAENNLNRSADELIVADAIANEGPTIKRWRPRAQGRAFPIHKPMTHITVVVADREA